MNRDTLTKVAIGTVSAVVGLSAGLAGIASAQSGTGTGTTTSGMAGMHRMMHGHGMHGRGVLGQVTGVSGNTITLTGKNGKTYTIDASSSTIEKMVTIGVGDIKVGDTLGVQGSVSGQNVTAQHILDGVPPRGQR